MAEGSSSGSSTAVVAVVAIIVIALLVYFVFLRGGNDDAELDVDVDLGGSAMELVVPVRPFA